MGIKRSLKNNMRYRAAILAAGMFFISWGSASAATLQINSPSTTLSYGETATLSIVVDTEGVAVNSAEAQIVFPADLVEVLSVSKASSVFSLWVEEPSFSNTAGIITFNGGVPTPGYTGSRGLVVSVVVKAKKVGEAVFTFSNTAVRANDGLGTNVLRSQQGKTIIITKNEEPTVNVPALPGPILKLTSSTHQNQDLWYKDNNPIFQWVIPKGTDAVQTAIDNYNFGTPRITYTPAIGEKVVQNLEDGTWYFKVRARKGGVWGPVSVYIVRIDTTPPEKKASAFVYDERTKTLSINTEVQDITSGINHYELFINNVLVKNISPAEFVSGTYAFPFDIPGNHTVKLTAVDNAGNTAELPGTFSVTIIEAPQSKSVGAISLFNERLKMIAVGTLFIFVILILMAIAFCAGCYCGRLQTGSKIHAALVEKGNSEMLLVLKKYLEKQVEILQRTRVHRILTKEEKEFKKVVEGDLDEVDRVIQEQKK